MGKKLTILLVLPVLVLGLWCRVCAAEQPEPGQTASVTFVMDFDGTPLEGGNLTMYRVAEIDFQGGRFVLLENLPKDGPALDDLTEPGLAERLKELAAANGLEPNLGAIAKGKAVFSGLELGLYVVCQRSGEETPGYAAIDPFLISLPQRQGDAWVYDLTASPKVPLVPASTEPTAPTAAPTQPGGQPNLPQTGQLNWPVPLMAVLGLGLFALGWVLFFGSRRRV